MQSKTPTESHRATLENGPQVVSGKLVWTSASGITTADPNSYGGCLRKWFYEAVEGRKPPPTRAMLGGTDLHKELEDHLRTGVSLTSPLALAGRMFIPHPGNSILVEKPIRFATRGGTPIFGHVDLYNLRESYIDADGVLQSDPPWSFEVKDWKTTSDFQYAKSERELAENIQLVTYAEAGFQMWPDLEHARLTHVYFRTKGRPEAKLVTIRRSRDEVASRWNYAESVVESMVEAAGALTAEQVPANKKSCFAYGKCPHVEYCAEPKRTALDNVFGKLVTDWRDPMAFLPPDTSKMAFLPTEDTRKQLEDEEKRMRAQVAQQQAALPQGPAQLQEVCARLLAYGFGFPALGGNAAQAYAAMGGQSVPAGFVYQGMAAPSTAKRSLHSIQLTEVAHIFQLENGLAQEKATPVAPPAPVQLEFQYTPPLPPKAKQFADAVLTEAVLPELVRAAATTVAPFDSPMQRATAVAGMMASHGILPPDAPESRPELAMARMPTDTTEVSDKPKRGRPSKKGNAPVIVSSPPPVDDTIVVSTPALPVPAEVSKLSAAPIVPAQESTLPEPLSPRSRELLNAGIADVKAGRVVEFTPDRGPSVVLINARAVSLTTRSLAPYVDYINAELSKRYSVTADGKPGIQDVRCAPKDSVLAFGGWRGAVREIVKADPPENGDFHLDTYGDDLNEVVADALRVVAENKGWLYVRGMPGR